MGLWPSRVTLSMKDSPVTVHIVFRECYDGCCGFSYDEYVATFSSKESAQQFIDTNPEPPNPPLTFFIVSEEIA